MTSESGRRGNIDETCFKLQPTAALKPGLEEDSSPCPAADNLAGGGMWKLRETVTEQPAGGIEDKVIAMCKTTETDNCSRLPVNIAACEEGGHQVEQRWGSRSRATPVSR